MIDACERASSPPPPPSWCSPRRRAPPPPSAPSPAAAFLVFAAPAGAALDFGACPGPVHAGGRCATVSVPLDRSGEVPGTIGISVERLPARGHSRGTLLALAGGPGDAASAVFARARDALQALRTEHDVVLVDQRGTGRSAPIDCPELAGGNPGGVAACAARLGPAVHLYTTASFADDLEDVRRALGARRVTLYGVSYGTYVAAAYARRHPEGVERLILDSPVDQAVGDDAFAREGFAALPGALRAECAGGRCRGITRDPYADLLAAVHMLANYQAGRGTTSFDELSVADAGLALLASDINSDLRAELPAGLASLRRGDTLLLKHAADAAELSTPDDPRLYSPGLHIAAACEDYAPAWDRSVTSPDERRAEARRRFDAVPARRFAPFSPDLVFLSLDAAQCADWPIPAISPAVTGALPDVPALLLAGGADLRTPPSVARRVARELPHAKLVEVEATGHAVAFDEPCGQRVVAAFLAQRALPSCRPADAAFPPLPLPPKRWTGSLAAAAKLTYA